MSKFQDIKTIQTTMALTDTRVTLPNEHSFYAVLLQILPTTTDTFTFTSTADDALDAYYIPLRMWDIGNELHTTAASVTGGTTGIFTGYMEGMKSIRIEKVSGTTAAPMHAVMHKSAGGHIVWTAH